MSKISCIILNDHNRDIKRTLESVKWCDEVIVWTKPVNGDWATARNEAMATARNEWVLFIDSDESLEGDTLQRLQGVTLKKDGYFLKRIDIFWGHEMRFGETGTTKLLRFGRKSAGRWVRKVHEYWDIKNACLPAGRPEYILHHPHPTIKEFIDQINFYTEIDAKELLKEGKKFSYIRLFFNPVGKFIQNYFLRLGFLDGVQGFVYAFMMSFHSLVVRVKMWESHGL